MAPPLKHDWPADGEMVALFALHGSRSAVARSLGIHETVLKAYLRRTKRTALRATCVAVQPDKKPHEYRTPESHTTNYPSADEMVLLMAGLRSFKGVAAALGVSRGSLRDYLSRRPDLDVRMRCHQVPRLTPEEARERNRKAGREHMRRKRLADPEGIRASKRTSERKRRAGKVTAVGAVEYAAVLEHDPCTYCGGPSEEIDHIEPIARGGTGDFENLTASCASCNRRKYARPFLYFMWERTG